MSDFLESTKDLLGLNSSDSLSDTISSKVDQGLGYLKGRYEQWASGWTINSGEPVPGIPIKTTPIFSFAKWASGIETDASMRSMLNAKSGLEKLNRLKQILKDNEKLGVTTIQHDEFLGVLFPGIPKGSIAGIDAVKRAIPRAEERLERQTFESRSQSITDSATSIVEGLNAISPFLVAATAFKPEYTKRLMAAHLLSDAATGVLNFRSPGRSEEFGLVDTLSPYMTMMTLGMASKYSGGL
jgi:hypothetical protein